MPVATEMVAPLYDDCEVTSDAGEAQKQGQDTETHDDRNLVARSTGDADRRGRHGI